MAPDLAGRIAVNTVEQGYAYVPFQATDTMRSEVEKGERGFEKVTATNREERREIEATHTTPFLQFSHTSTFELLSHLFPPQEPRQDATRLALLAAAHLRRLPTP